MCICENTLSDYKLYIGHVGASESRGIIADIWSLLHLVMRTFGIALTSHLRELLPCFLHELLSFAQLIHCLFVLSSVIHLMHICVCVNIFRKYNYYNP